jgi:hypothetical protein
MSTQRIYALPVEVTDWKFDGATEIQFNWEYDDGSSALLELYEKGKKQQWDASTRLDWSLELNPDNPMELKDEAISIYDTDHWRKMTIKERSWLRRNLQANTISQFTHGEQGALIATAKIVATVPDMNAKFYARRRSWTRRAMSRPTSACCTRSSNSPIRSTRRSRRCSSRR